MELIIVWALTYALINAARRAVVDTIATVRAPANTLTPPIPASARAGAPTPARPPVPARSPAAPAATVKPGVVHKTSRKAAAVVRGAGESAKYGWHEGWERGRQKYQQRTGTEPDQGSAPIPAPTPAAPTQPPPAPVRPAPSTTQPAPARPATAAPSPAAPVPAQPAAPVPAQPAAADPTPVPASPAPKSAPAPTAPADPAPSIPVQPATVDQPPATAGEVDDDGPLASVTPLRPQFAAYAKPHPEGDKVPTDPNQPTNADIATIIATRVFFEALERACESDVQQIELALGNLAELELDQQTLDGFQSTQEDAQRAAGRCRSTVAILNAIHSAMEEAVNATPDAAKTEFYQPV